MSRISYPQLVKDIADALRIATNTTEPIVVGELANKVVEAANNSGINNEYKSITYNKDNTITLIDKNDVIHSMSCTYENNKMISITYDGRMINLSYDDNDALIGIGNKEINLKNAPTQPEVIQKLTSCKASVGDIILPTYTEPLAATIKNSNIEIGISVALESEV
jgi:hypothetical protein